MSAFFVCFRAGVRFGFLPDARSDSFDNILVNDKLLEPERGGG